MDSSACSVHVSLVSCSACHFKTAETLAEDVHVTTMRPIRIDWADADIELDAEIDMGELETTLESITISESDATVAAMNATRVASTAIALAEETEKPLE